jgi:hypothetical protein
MIDDCGRLLGGYSSSLATLMAIVIGADSDNIQG